MATHINDISQQQAAANGQLTFAKMPNRKFAAELPGANYERTFQNKEKANSADEDNGWALTLTEVANKYLAYTSAFIHMRMEKGWGCLWLPRKWNCWVARYPLKAKK